MNAALAKLAGQFAECESLLSVTPLGNGLINDTFLVKSRIGDFVLQGINPLVFPQPKQVMQNLLRLGEHIRGKPESAVRLQIPGIIRTLDGQAFYQDEDRRIWRALRLISPAESRERIRHDEEAAQVGFALAHFHRLCGDLPAAQLHDSLPGFHITPGYFKHYQQLLTQPLQVAVDAEFERCRAFIQNHQHDVGILEKARQQGDIQEQVIHGDPKLNNFLFQPGSHRVVSLIDLDTVKPGLLHYDIGDCIRSCCHGKADDSFDLDRCRIILSHYLQEIGAFFTQRDYDYLYAAIWLIPFELGLRFFSDYLSGNSYFKVNEPRQNLKRAIAQFAFCDNIFQQRDALLTCINDLKQSHPKTATFDNSQ